MEKSSEEFQSSAEVKEAKIPSRPEAVAALEIMNNILSGVAVAPSPAQQQQVITEIKTDSSFLGDFCHLTPQKVLQISVLPSPSSSAPTACGEVPHGCH